MTAKDRREALLKLHGLTKCAFVSTFRAAEILGLAISTVQRKCREGRLDARWNGKTIRIPTSALLDYIESMPKYKPKTKGASRAK